MSMYVVRSFCLFLSSETTFLEKKKKIKPWKGRGFGRRMFQSVISVITRRKFSRQNLDGKTKENSKKWPWESLQLEDLLAGPGCIYATLAKGFF